MKIGEDGVITARYSNGVTQASGMLGACGFPKRSRTGPARWWRLRRDPLRLARRCRAPLASADFGALRAGALEESNVDLTAELVNMMTAQRAYQANAQTIKTQDQVMSTLVNLR